MKFLILGTLILSLFFPSNVHAREHYNYSETYAVIVGVLKWQDTGLTTYSERFRKDKELYLLLIKKGVKPENILFLEDSHATLKNIKAGLKKIIARAGANSTFIFYYEGHGLNREGTYYFANYDIQTDNVEQTGFSVNFLTRYLYSHFKGKKAIFMGDCCYSGSLKIVSEKLSSRGILSVTLTSSDANNTSTSNWTFTQSIIDSLSGNPLADRNRDGVITFGEMVEEAKDAMRFRERQRYGFYSHRFPQEMVMALPRQRNNSHAGLGQYRPGQYIEGLYQGGYQPARITGFTATEAICEFYFYSEKIIRKLALNQIRTIHFNRFPAGTDVNVVWQDRIYPARIQQEADGFHFITYPGWGNHWDEWVMDNRIVQGEFIYVKWQGKWYPAKILKKEGNRYFITYIGWPNRWDEWVTAERMRFNNRR